MAKNDEKRSGGGPDEDMDFLDIVLRATGWVYLATGLGMLGFFLYWLRGQ